jgi:beta-mannosidase
LQSILLSLIISSLTYSLAFSQTVTFQITGVDANWKFRRAGDSNWLQAKVPGTVHTDLMKNQIIQDPYFGDREKEVQWIENNDWEYQTNFECPAELLTKNNFEFQFNGLDTYADVYLNDSLILQSENMFRTYKVRIDKSQLRSNNILLIRFHSPIKKGKEAASLLPFPLAGDVDGKAFTRKAQYQYGWDWGPRLLTSGIWQSITLTSWSTINLRDAYVVTKFVSDEKATLDLKLTIESETSLELLTQIIVDTESAQNVLSKLQIKPGLQEYTIPFEINHPIRWNCNGMGIPYLYNIQFAATTSKPSITLSRKIRFGIRTIEVVQEKDSLGQSFYFRINGRPVYVKGANYIPPHNFMPSVTIDDYRSIIDDAVSVNMNMIRVWGGGVYADDAFYDLCDEKGLLVWQDFMFAGAMVPGDSDFVENVSMEVIDHVQRLRHHPSIALWCGNNEIDEAWHNWGWQAQYKYTNAVQDELWGNYKKLFHHIIPGILAQYDSARFYWPSSPSIGWGRKESLLQGDSHYWGIWWGKEPFENYNSKVGRFMSEYGFQALPAIATIEKFTDAQDRRLENKGPNRFSKVMNAHQKHPAGFETIDEYLKRDYKAPKDFNSYVYVSQLLQRDGIATAIEAHRRAKPYCMGTLYWQLNDCWPVTSWSSRDYFGNWKALHFEIKKLFQPVIVSIQEEGDLCKVTVVSDLPQVINGRLQLTILKFIGDSIWNFSKEVQLSGNSGTLVYEFRPGKMIGKINTNEIFLHARLVAENEVLAYTNYFFEKPKDLSLPTTSISCKINYLHDQSTMQNFPFVYAVECSSPLFAKDVFLDVDVESYKLSDNFFDLLPGEKKMLYLYSQKHHDQNLIPVKATSLIDCY